MDESYRLQRQDMLRYQVDEITAAQLSEEEEEELVSQREIIRNAEKITSALGAIYDLLNGTEDQQGLLSSFELLGEELSTASRYLRSCRSMMTVSPRPVMICRSCLPPFGTAWTSINLIPGSWMILKTGWITSKS